MHVKQRPSARCVDASNTLTAFPPSCIVEDALGRLMCMRLWQRACFTRFEDLEAAAEGLLTRVSAPRGCKIL